MGNPMKSAQQVMEFAQGHADQLANDQEREEFWTSLMERIADAD
jgi:hypothetical protein